MTHSLWVIGRIKIFIVCNPNIDFLILSSWYFYDITKVIWGSFNRQMTGHVKIPSRTFEGPYEGQNNLEWPWYCNKNNQLDILRRILTEPKYRCSGAYDEKFYWTCGPQAVVAGKSGISMIALHGHKNTLSKFCFVLSTELRNNHEQKNDIFGVRRAKIWVFWSLQKILTTLKSSFSVFF